MNVILAPRLSLRMGLQVFVLLLVWVVVAGLSWADLIGGQIDPPGGATDTQWATEVDVDELRDDATAKAITYESGPTSLQLHASANSSRPPRCPSHTSLPTCDLLSRLSVYRV
ncbi:MAG: hypothetical protein JSR62_16260 [Nitrospira sp.]|nr:hypothetical protein [Nitrospira sp.]